MAEITTGERPPSKARDEIIREANRLDETTLHSAKGHHCAARRWTGGHMWLGLPLVVISGIAALAQAGKDVYWIAIVAAVSAIAVTILSAVTTFLNPNEKANSHLTAAHAFDKLNNEARMFAAIDCWQEESTEVLTAKLRELVDRKDKLNTDSPQIPRWAYLEGKKGIDEGEASFKVDKDPPKIS